jgi:hypothetical protein
MTIGLEDDSLRQRLDAPIVTGSCSFFSLPVHSHSNVRTCPLLSILNLFRIGIRPSSSHTVGPMRIARRFVASLAEARKLGDVSRIGIALQGSLALTGVGHGSVDGSCGPRGGKE